MSDNFKTISKARDIAKALDTKLGWGKTDIIKEMGITFPLYNDIMDLDPVAINIRKPTVEKLKAFIKKHEAVLDKPPAPFGMTREGKDDPFPVIPKKSTPHPAPPSMNGDPLSELDALEKKFAARGYKLETRIIKIS